MKQFGPRGGDGASLAPPLDSKIDIELWSSRINLIEQNLYLILEVRGNSHQAKLNVTAKKVKEKRKQLKKNLINIKANFRCFRFWVVWIGLNAVSFSRSVKEPRKKACSLPYWIENGKVFWTKRRDWLSHVNSWNTLCSKIQRNQSLQPKVFPNLPHHKSMTKLILMTQPEIFVLLSL